MQFSLVMVAVIVVVVWYAAKADERADIARAHGFTLPTAGLPTAGMALGNGITIGFASKSASGL